jgi:hypothetical protein
MADGLDVGSTIETVPRIWLIGRRGGSDKAGEYGRC